MNELNVNLQHSIVALSARGWSRRRIARELGINRETVGRYLRLAQPKPAISTLGSEPDSDAKPAISTTGSTPGRQSLCEPYSPIIEAAVAAGLSAQRIYQDLICAHSFPGSYQAVKRFVRHLRQAQPIPFVRMEVEPGSGSTDRFWTRRVGRDRWETQTTASLSNGLEPFAQRPQRSDLASDDRKLHSLHGEWIPPFRWCSQNAGHRQLACSGHAGGLVRPRT